MKFLKKIRASRAELTQPAAENRNESCLASMGGNVSNINDQNNNRKSIFRGKGSSLQRTSSIVIPQSLTWTMSEEESVTSTDKSHTALASVPGVLGLTATDLTKQKMAIAELKEMHKDDLAEKEWEIAQIKDALEDKLTKTKHAIEELKEKHQDELAEKDEAIADLKVSLKEMESELAHAIVELSRQQDVLHDTEVSLVETEMELDDTKKQMVVVISTLMVYQEKLHEKEEELKAVKSLVNFGKGVVSGFFSAF